MFSNKFYQKVQNELKFINNFNYLFSSKRNLNGANGSQCPLALISGVCVCVCGGGGGGGRSRILTHWVPTLLSMYPQVLTPPLQIGTQYQSLMTNTHTFLEKRGTHSQIGTQHQILDYHFWKIGQHPKCTHIKTKLIGNQYEKGRKQSPDSFTLIGREDSI